MIITKDQLALVTAPSFTFDAPFLDRVADALAEFVGTDGTLAAEETCGPLTELHQNAALLNLCIQGGKYRLTAQDQSRAPGIVRLLKLVTELDDLCQRVTGISLKRLNELFDKANRTDPDAGHTADAVTAVAEEVAAGQIGESQRTILTCLDEQERALRVVRLCLDGPDRTDQQLVIGLDAWKRAASLLVRISTLPLLDLATITALERLSDALDDLQDVLSREGVE